MGYKKMKQKFGFADFALASSPEHSRSIRLKEKISVSIDWKGIESVLMSHYTVGTSGEGADAYLPLMLFKFLLLQKCFHINSDTELEKQTNDRLSFKSSWNCLLTNSRKVTQPSHALEEECQNKPWTNSTRKSCASLKARA